ncbi:MAG: DUF2141 domain-containing protein [Williamsia sp.]|nr:DUF2141 domain-containing protein [Williamsia sp.]
MNSFLCNILFFFISVAPAHPPQSLQQGGKLTVEITGLHNNKGYVLLSLFSQKEGFPSHPDKAYANDRTSIKDGKAFFEFKSLPAGTYAIAVLHDENENLKMDTKFLGLPKEGYGFSQDPTLVFGPPSFKNASFQHNATQLIRIAIKY